MSGPWIVAFGALAALVLVVAFIVLGTVRRAVTALEQAERLLADMRKYPSGLLPGMAVPSFRAMTADGGTFTDADFRDTTTALLFLGSSCAACAEMVTDLRMQRVPSLPGRLVVATQDQVEAQQLTRTGVTVLLQEDGMVARVFQSDRVPHVFVIDTSGRVAATGWPNNWKGIAALLVEAQKGGENTDHTMVSMAVGSR